MKLNEQIHKNLYRPYYRGQRLDYDENMSSFKNEKFYTTNLYYAYFCAKRENGHIIEYRLKNEVNIFNQKSKTDYFVLHKYFIDNHMPTRKLELLKDSDWTYIFESDENRNDTLNIIKNELKYDGFFNYEYSNDMKIDIERNNFPIKYPFNEKNPAIGLFNKDAMKIIDEYKLEDIALSDSFNEYKNAEAAFIKKFFEDIVESTKDKNHAYQIIFKDITSKYNLLLDENDALEILNNCYNKWTPQKIKEIRIAKLKMLLDCASIKLNEDQRNEILEKIKNEENS